MAIGKCRSVSTEDSEVLAFSVMHDCHDLQKINEFALFRCLEWRLRIWNLLQFLAVQACWFEFHSLTKRDSFHGKHS